jgi:predicted metal-dependent hydrolase
MSDRPFEYRLRQSPRARYVRLRVTPEHGLEVIVPEGFKRVDQIPRMLQHKRSWIHAALERADVQRRLFDPVGAWQLPARLSLPAVSRSWDVVARAAMRHAVRVRPTDASGIEVSGRIDDEAACRKALGRWLTERAHEFLVPRLQQLSERTGLAFSGVSVRRQKTRWASCSRERAISLNVKLLFLSPELADYVLVHELCHTVHMNHSPRFWALVAGHCPDHRRLDVGLREMWYRVPRWARG